MLICYYIYILTNKSIIKMKNLKKLTRSGLKEVFGGILNPHPPKLISCYNVIYCWDTMKDNGFPELHVGLGSEIPANAERVNPCGWRPVANPSPECGTL